MNIFFLDHDPVVAAQMQHDKHVVKMILESAQMLSAVCHRYGAAERIDGLYAPTWASHPCTRWAGDSQENFLWLCHHAFGLCDEYTYRYGKKHASMDVIHTAYALMPDFPSYEMTEPAQAMPDEFKVPGNAVEAYRRYYLGRKVGQSRWTRRPVPEIFQERVLEMAKKGKTVEQTTEQTTDALATETAAAPAAEAPAKTKHNKKLVLVGDYTNDSKISWLITSNPRVAGRATYDRFAAYFGAETVGQYLAKGGTRGDLLWDLRSGYLSIEGITLSGDITLRKKPTPPQRKSKVEKTAEEGAAAAEVAAAVKEEVIE
jgi:hypothetical protein